MGSFKQIAAFALLCAFDYVSAAFDAEANFSTPISFYYSRPDISPPAVNVTVQNLDKVEPGYFFIGPYQELQAGAYIYDKMGNLIYSGFGEAGPWNVHNLRSCQYNGTLHLCMFQGNQQPGYARGHAVIMDSNYQIVKTISSGNSAAPADQHEFKIATGDDGEDVALISIYEQKPYDLSRLGIKSSQGWVSDTIFQVISLKNNSVLFEWSPLEHVDPYDGYVKLKGSDVSGDGLGPLSAWDFFHLNSVEKSQKTGHYLISARHMSRLYFIDHTTGDILWTLQAGGNTTYRCTNFNFSFPHDARIQHENDTHMVISIFDNASNNYNNTSPYSAGKIITLDHSAKTATLTGPLTLGPGHDGGHLLSASQGNTQILANGNVFHAWGSWPVFSEHDGESGDIVWAANIGPFQGHVMSYRAFSGPWTSIPANTVPAIWSYSKDSDGLTALYASWNGCTEVASWRFHGSQDMDDAFHAIGETSKKGFETSYQSHTHYRYAFVEALDSDGKSLRNSSTVKTWIPSAQLAASCADSHCPGVGGDA